MSRPPFGIAFAFALVALGLASARAETVPPAPAEGAPLALHAEVTPEPVPPSTPLPLHPPEASATGTAAMRPPAAAAAPVPAPAEAAPAAHAEPAHAEPAHAEAAHAEAAHAEAAHAEASHAEPAPITKTPAAAPAVIRAETPLSDDTRPPYALVRKLQVAQEQMARGTRTGQAGQAQMMALIPSRFLAVDPAVWRDPRNARAAILYLFSGGRPSVIRTILSRSTMPRDTDALLKGALAYAEGQDQIALQLLQPIDPRTLPSYLGGHLALIEATLLAAKDKAKAEKLLDLARLLVPGTLVEEAALRRQIFLDTEPAALGNFVFLSRQYIHRFRNSIYAENFKRHFAATAIQFAASGDIAELGMLDAVVAELPPDEQSALYLAVAKAAIVQGKTAAARFAAERAATVAKATAHDAARAQLYINAALIVSDDVTKGVAALEAADRSRLSPADADLRDAALAVARSVTTPVPEAADGVTVAGASDDAGSMTLMDRAHQAIANGDKLLAEGVP